jgi:TM2 domain-containing membrane protein YozV
MKTRQNAILLAVFLGGIGTHWFYLNKPWRALLYLVFCLTLIPAFMALIDAYGFYKLGAQGFANKYSNADIAVTSQGIVTSETHVKCPDCRELIFKDACKCRFCGCQLTPQ